MGYNKFPRTPEQEERNRHLRRQHRQLDREREALKDLSAAFDKFFKVQPEKQVAR